MATIVVAAFAALALVGLAACGGDDAASTSSDDVAQITSREEQFYALTRTQDWQGVWELLSPRSRVDCGYEAFASQSRSIVLPEGYSWSKYDVTDIKVEVTGNTATDTYTVTHDGTDINTGSDSWVKVNGLWYIDNNGKSACDIR